MTTDYIYNPTAKPSKAETFLNLLSDAYYGSAAGQFAIEATFFIVASIVIAAAVFAVAG